jgi:hypothetical protein
MGGSEQDPGARKLLSFAGSKEHCSVCKEWDDIEAPSRVAKYIKSFFEYRFADGEDVAAESQELMQQVAVAYNNLVNMMPQPSTIVYDTALIVKEARDKRDNYAGLTAAQKRTLPSLEFCVNKMLELGMVTEGSWQAVLAADKPAAAKPGRDYVVADFRNSSILRVVMESTLARLGKLHLDERWGDDVYHCMFVLGEEEGDEMHDNIADLPTGLINFIHVAPRSKIPKIYFKPAAAPAAPAVVPAVVPAAAAVVPAVVPVVAEVVPAPAEVVPAAPAVVPAAAVVPAVAEVVPAAAAVVPAAVVPAAPAVVPAAAVVPAVVPAPAEVAPAVATSVASPKKRSRELAALGVAPPTPNKRGARNS